MRSVRAAAAFLVCGLLSCDSPTEPGTGITLRDGQLVQGTLAPNSAYDEWVISVPLKRFRVLFQARSGSESDGLEATIFEDGAQIQPSIVSWGNDHPGEMRESWWVVPKAGSRYTVRVTRRSGSDGRYALRLYVEDPAPEHVSAEIEPNQVIEGERIDAGGDVDEFRLSGSAGDTWIAFAQSLVPGGADLRLAVIDPVNGQTVGELWAMAPSNLLEHWTTGRIVLQNSGTHLVRITGHEAGAYRFVVRRIDRAPEQAQALQQLGAVVQESIGMVGDVDEFTFHASAGQMMNVLVQLEQGLAGGLTVEVWGPGGFIDRVALAQPTASLDDAGTGRFDVPVTGTHTLRVYGEAFGPPGFATGSYRFELLPIDPFPEDGKQLTLDAGPITGTLDRPGDIDDYQITGTAGQLVMLHISGASLVRGHLRAELLSDDGKLVAAATTDPEPHGAGWLYSVRATLPASGTYTVRVRGDGGQSHESESWTSLATGDFTLEAYTVSSDPEQIAATVSIGETVTGEAIGRPGDLDVFAMQGEAGREVNIFLGGATYTGYLALHLQRADTSDPPHIFTFLGLPTLDGPSTGRVVLENALYIITVDPMWAVPARETGSHGSYAFRVFPIDRAPEGRAATYALGDTVSGEPLYPNGDIDEYTFIVVEETRVRLFWEPPNASALWKVVLGYLLDDTTGEIVWTTHGFDTGAPEERILPPAQYRFSVFAPNTWGAPASDPGDTPTLNYRFAFIPQ